MTAKEKFDAAREAITKVAGDTTVDEAQTKEWLEELQSDCECAIMALKEQEDD